jgi:hypothetical protein
MRDLFSFKQAKTDVVMPTLQDVSKYVEKAKELLDNPTFSLKRKLLRESLDRIVATQQEINVYGYLPLDISKGNVEYESLHRHRRPSQCRQVHTFQRPPQTTSSAGG